MRLPSDISCLPASDGEICSQARLSAVAVKTCCENSAAPIGMAGGPEEHEPAYDDEVIAAADTVFDVVAVPSETPLIAAARAAGKQVITGAEVIALQAAEQFERYTGVRPTPEQIAEASAISRA